MKTIAIDNSAILIASLATFISSEHIKNKTAPLSDPIDVETFSNIMISRISTTICDIAELGDRVVLCVDHKDKDSKYWRHYLHNRVASLYKLNRDTSLFDSVDGEGLKAAKDRYMSWCGEKGIPALSMAGFEADDIIAELAYSSEYTIIISPDGDFNQLIDSPKRLRIDPIRWKAYRCMPNESDWFNDNALENMWGDSILKTMDITDVSLVNANYALLVKIFMGDKSDCIPSVHTYTTSTGKTMGVGKATADKMIKEVFSSSADIKHYTELTDAEKRAMCAVLKNPDVNDVLKRMDENADMIILRNKNLLSITNPVVTLVESMDNDSNSGNQFNGVEGISVNSASDVIIRTIETPKEFNDYVFD